MYVLGRGRISDRIPGIEIIWPYTKYWNYSAGYRILKLSAGYTVESDIQPYPTEIIWPDIRQFNLLYRTTSKVWYPAQPYQIGSPESTTKITLCFKLKSNFKIYIHIAIKIVPTIIADIASYKLKYVFTYLLFMLENNSFHA